MRPRIVIDTNRYADLDRNDPVAMQLVSHAEAVAIPFIVLAELRVGFQLGSRQVENERRLQRFLNATRVDVLYANDATVQVFADLKVQLRKQGTPIPDHDVWIAALTLQHGMKLYARDRHFDYISQLARI